LAGATDVSGELVDCSLGPAGLMEMQSAAAAAAEAAWWQLLCAEADGSSV